MCMHVCLRVCKMHEYARMCVCISLSVCVCVCVCAHMHVYMCLCRSDLGADSQEIVPGSLIVLELHQVCWTSLLVSPMIHLSSLFFP